MKRHLVSAAFLLAPLLATGCAAAAAAGAAVGAGYIVSQQDNVQIAQVALDVDVVWPSVKETLGYFQEPGTEITVQDFPRTVQARVDGAKVLVEVEALDLDRTTVRVSAEKYLGKDDATASEVLQGILKSLEKVDQGAK